MNKITIGRMGWAQILIELDDGKIEAGKPDQFDGQKPWFPLISFKKTTFLPRFSSRSQESWSRAQWTWCSPTAEQDSWGTSETIRLEVPTI